MPQPIGRLRDGDGSRPKGLLARLNPWNAALAAAVALCLTAPAAHAFGELFATPGNTPKDFAIIKADGWYHVYTIRTVVTPPPDHHNGESEFEHWVSQDLYTWTFVDTDFKVSADTTAFDSDHIWAPHIVFDNGTYYMYYTGARDHPTTGVLTQALGVATTTALSTEEGGTEWVRYPTPLLECTPGWRNCTPGDFRDLHVMRSPYLHDYSGWLGYYVTQLDSAMADPPFAQTDNYVVGMLRAPASQPTQWADKGPIITTAHAYQPSSTVRSFGHESPHLIHHGSSWYLFFTSRQFTLATGSIRYLTGPVAYGDLWFPYPPAEDDWTYHGQAPNIDVLAFASETFTESYADGTQDDYFCYVADDFITERHLEFAQLNWAPCPHHPEAVPYELIDPLRITGFINGDLIREEGENVLMLMTAGNDPNDPHTRSAHLELYEEDAGQRTPIAPSSIGCPGRIDGFVGNQGQQIDFNCKFFTDDDDTPDQLEVVIAYRGVETTLRIRRGPANLKLAGAFEPKDFSVIKVDDLYHAFYIKTNTSTGAETVLGHATSPDLWNWSFPADSFQVAPGPAWDDANVWAPSLIEKNGTFYMFYTGVSAADGIQRIGVASTTDRLLSNWTRLQPDWVFECNDVGWARCDPNAFRDPFVMPSSGLPGDPGWLMYYVTHPAAADVCDYVVGIGHASGNSMTNWTDLKMLWDTHLVSSTIESPHVIYHDPFYYLFFTDDWIPGTDCGLGGGIRYMIGSTPTGDLWIDQGVMFGGLGTYIGSDAFTTVYPDGTQEDFFGAVYDGDPRQLQFFQIEWSPNLEVNLFNPLRLLQLSASPSAPAIAPEGSMVTLTFTTEHSDGRTRRAPIEVFEVDGATRRPIAPELVGLPATIALNQHVQNYSFNILSNYPENDGTNDRAEVVIRVKGVEFPVIYVGRDGTPPAAITSLSATMYRNMVDLLWFAPGDDGQTGTALAYDLRYSTTPITAQTFFTATPIPTDPPGSAGSGEYACFDGLQQCTNYSFAIRTVDERYNWSGISNVLWKKTKCTGQTYNCEDDFRAGSSREEVQALPAVLEFGAPAPNPAADGTQVSYAVPADLEGAHLDFSLFDVQGRRVRTLARGAAVPGNHTLSWDLRDDHERLVARGIYFLRMAVGSSEEVQRVLVVRR